MHRTRSVESLFYPFGFGFEQVLFELAILRITPNA
jgi:hypothetical protein